MWTQTLDHLSCPIVSTGPQAGYGHSAPCHLPCAPSHNEMCFVTPCPIRKLHDLSKPLQSSFSAPLLRNVLLLFTFHLSLDSSHSLNALGMGTIRKEGDLLYTLLLLASQSPALIVSPKTPQRWPKVPVLL